MAVYLTKEKQEAIFAEHGGAAANAGAPESQIALFTYRIKSLSEHLEDGNKKDHSCRRTLLGLVGKRRRMLQYLRGKDLEGYRSLIAKLGIRDIKK